MINIVFAWQYGAGVPAKEELLRQRNGRTVADVGKRTQNRIARRDGKSPDGSVAQNELADARMPGAEADGPNRLVSLGVCRITRFREISRPANREDLFLVRQSGRGIGPFFKGQKRSSAAGRFPVSYLEIAAIG